MIPLFFTAVAALSIAIAAGYEGWGRYFRVGGEMPGLSRGYQPTEDLDWSDPPDDGSGVDAELFMDALIHEYIVQMIRKKLMEMAVEHQWRSR